MYQVVKRDGQIADFDISKIAVAITKAFQATKKEFNQDIIDFLALKVTADYQGKIHDGKITVEVKTEKRRNLCLNRTKASARRG